MPLSGIYSSVAELKQDAEMQLNISGSNFVVHVLALDDDYALPSLRELLTQPPIEHVMIHGIFGANGFSGRW
jgi:hypothetical protein